MKIRCPQCQGEMNCASPAIGEEMRCSHCEHTFTLESILVSGDGDETVSTGPPETFESHPVGERLGHFTILRPIGRGGFGTVYLAHDNLLQQEVAIKVPRRGRFTQAQAEMFLREARIAAQLRDVANVVTVHEIGYSDDHVYIVSSFIDGKPLSRWRKSNRPSLDRSIRVLIKIATAMEHAHNKGIVHRDLKPNNVIMASDDEPYITDFGLASYEFGELETVARRGHILGTIPYLAPEQVRGDSHLADERSDIYSLGTMLYEILTDEQPFPAKSTNVFELILAGEFDPPSKLKPDVDPQAEQICLKAMQLDPDRRYHRIGEFLSDLRKLVDDENEPKIARLLTRRNAVVAGLTLIAVGLIGWTLGSTIGNNSEGERVPVRITSFSSWVRLAAVPIDPDSGEVLHNQVEVFEENESILRLRPGKYWLELQSSSGSFVLVQRYIPSRDKWESKPKKYDHYRWTIEDGVVVLPEISIKGFLDDPNGVELELGRGADATKLKLSHIRTNKSHSRDEIAAGEVAPAYYLGTHEVTLGDWIAVFGGPPKPMQDAGLTDPNFPVVFITRDEQLHFCELVGVNLMTVKEFQFAQSNCGESMYPWGNYIPDGEEYVLGAVGRSGFDQTNDSRIAPPVQGLRTGVLEATFDSHPGMSKVMEAFEFPIQYRIVGGRDKIKDANGERSTETPGEISLGPLTKELLTQPIETTVPGAHMNRYRGLGFRVSKPSMPRFLP